MPDIKLYDYQRPPNMPEGVHKSLWFFPNKKESSLLAPKAPWTDGPAMVCSYDKDGNLINTRFVNSDGTYKDAT